MRRYDFQYSQFFSSPLVHTSAQATFASLLVFIHLRHSQKYFPRSFIHGISHLQTLFPLFLLSPSLLPPVTEVFLKSALHSNLDRITVQRSFFPGHLVYIFVIVSKKSCPPARHVSATQVPQARPLFAEGYASTTCSVVISLIGSISAHQELVISARLYRTPRLPARATRFQKP